MNKNKTSGFWLRRILSSRSSTVKSLVQKMHFYTTPGKSDTEIVLEHEQWRSNKKVQNISKNVSATIELPLPWVKG